MTVYTNEQPDVNADIAECLKSFRKKVEQEASTPTWEVEAAVVFVLDDMCDAFGLSEVQRAQVLGPGGVEFAQEASTTQVWPIEMTNGRHPPVRVA